MNEKLIKAVKADLVPSLGVTEPGAIAYAAACAARALGGEISAVTVGLNSCIYKNSFTCAVPGTDGMGCALAAALGAVMGDPEKKLMATEGANACGVQKAKLLVERGLAKAELEAVSPEVFIRAAVTGENGSACAIVRGRHDRLVSLTVNGKELVPERAPQDEAEEEFSVSSASFGEILDCVETAEGIGFTEEAVKMDLALFEEGRRSGLIPLTLARHGSGRPSSVKDRADLITAGAIEARVRGAAAPAMAITGSGSHGILCTLPVHETAAYYGISGAERQRALLLSMLVTKYIKELSGLLSTACGCVLAGGTGAALGIAYLMAKKGVGTGRPASREELERILFDTLDSMAASVTGMICHGGNTGCSLKAAVGVDMAFAAAEMAVRGAGAESEHGILGDTPEETMRNMGAVARGMLPAENTILEIMRRKSEKGSV